MRDAYLRSIEQIVDSGSQAMHPVPDGGFMSAVASVHQNEPGRQNLNNVGIADGKITQGNKNPSRRGTMLPDFEAIQEGDRRQSEKLKAAGETTYEVWLDW